ncbi:hypothetical protein DFH27DRAFT_656850 [Peziza echinospora]|nr:hypothetical protein DFH27DRAFT_656850 [Peziza echinospora]
MDMLHAMAMALPSEVDTFSDTSVEITLPFLGSPNAVQSDRMVVNKDGTFVYYGRSNLQPIYQAAIEMRVDGCTKYFVRGALGVGKSHLIAALACVLTRSGRKVAFLPDCRALVKAPLHGLLFALKFAFHGHPQELEELEAITSLEEIYQFCLKVAEEREHRVYFLIDQCNALDYMPQSGDRVAESSKAVVRTLLEKITKHHFKISSATANYLHGAADRLRSSSEKTLNLHHGLTEESEMVGWWQHQGHKLYQILNASERTELETFTGGIPLLLRIFGSLATEVPAMRSHEPLQSLQPIPPLSEDLQIIDSLYDKFWANEEALGLVDMIIDFIDEQCERLRGSEKLHEFRAAIDACLMGGRIDRGGGKLLDFRFFNIDSDGQGRVTCEFVRRIVSPYIRKVKGTATFFSPNFATELHLSTNPCVLGYQVEGMVLSHIAQNGLPEAGAEFAKVSDLQFYNKAPEFRQQNNVTLHVPKAFNHRAVDGILVHRGPREEGGIKAVMVGLQITISGRHEDACPPWLATAQQWSRSIEADEVEYRFCWIVENFDHISKSPKEIFSAKERAGKVVWPAHERLRVKIGAINPTIAHKLNIARSQ